MKIRGLIALAAIGVSAQPALSAQTTSNSRTSFNSLLAAGYEIKSVTDLSDAEQKAIWPDDTTSPFLMVTLEKGSALSVCVISMSNYINRDQTKFDDPTVCRR